MAGRDESPSEVDPGLRHDASVLAKEEGFPLEVVESLYESVLAELRPTARVREFLPVVVANRVRKELRSRNGRNSPRRGARTRHL